MKKQPASKANMRWNIPKPQTKAPGSVATQGSKKSQTHFALPLLLSIGRVMASFLMEWSGSVVPRRAWTPFSRSEYKSARARFGPSHCQG